MDGLSEFVKYRHFWKSQRYLYGQREDLDAKEMFRNHKTEKNYLKLESGRVTFVMRIIMKKKQCLSKYSDRGLENELISLDKIKNHRGHGGV